MYYICTHFITTVLLVHNLSIRKYTFLVLGICAQIFFLMVVFHACSVKSDSVTPWTVPGRLLCPWNFPGNNTGVGCHSFLQDLPDLGLEPASPALQADSLPLSYQGSPFLIVGYDKKYLRPVYNIMNFSWTWIISFLIDIPNCLAQCLAYNRWLISIVGWLA